MELARARLVRLAAARYVFLRGLRGSGRAAPLQHIARTLGRNHLHQDHVARLTLIASFLILAVPAQAQVTLGGVGPIRFGVEAKAAAQLLGEQVPREAVLPGACEYVPLKIRGRTYEFMVENGLVVRVDIRDRGLTTPSGARIGMAEADVRRLYGDRLRILPHKYSGGHYLIYVAASDTLRRLVFETEADTVTTWRMGIYPQVEYVEGCS
jgi:hypothetical protein